MHHPQRTILTIRPAPIAVAIEPLATWVVLLAAIGTGWWFRSEFERWRPGTWPLLSAMLAGVVVLKVVIEVARWLATRYTLTPTRIVAAGGVLGRTSLEIPLLKVQNVVVHRRLIERLFGIGSVRVESAGGTGVVLWWVGIDAPDKAASAIREAIGDAMKDGSLASSLPTPPATQPLIIGLTGSIGAGKTTVARMLGEMGAAVIDSDAQARQALDLPEVKATLKAWWGPDVIDSAGRVDRAKVGDIVFGNRDERERLERLIHPLVRQSRSGMIRQASEAGAEVVVADVPLLFEAGVDTECDMTVYVDAPQDVRMARVASRGWNDAELPRREASQLPIDVKKARADERVENSGNELELRQVVRELYERVKRRPRRTQTPN